MNKWIVMLALAAGVLLSGCREAGEWAGLVGKPVDDDGWRHDYADTTQDVWEAIRSVVRDNGKIIEEDAEEMEIRGQYIDELTFGSGEIEVKAKVYDKSEGDRIRTRLIVHCWWDAGPRHDPERETARDYCYTVYHLLREWKGEEPVETGITTTTDDPLKDDEAAGYYRVTSEDAYTSARDIIKKYGEISQEDKAGGYIRGLKKNELEDNAQEVRVQIYDRTEDEGPRVKISVRVTEEKTDKPRQDIAKNYLKAIRKSLESKLLPNEDK